ncbi:MAG: hypothetical protein MZV64_24390 [Ignavibacteriales bacterium]|nr:hypothetical protein [Ignavibacteriales bacterium]
MTRPCRALGMQLANPVAFNTGTCGGTPTGQPRATPPSPSSGGVLPRQLGFLHPDPARHHDRQREPHEIASPRGAVTTFNGVSSPDPTQSTRSPTCRA